MKPNRSFSWPFLIVLLAVIPFSVISGKQQEIGPDQRAVGLSFDVKRETTFVGLRKTTWWEVALVLPRDYYSKENLERIFHYYSEKHPDKMSILRVEVYADEETYQRHLKTPFCVLSVAPSKTTDEAQPDLPSKETWSIAHATYERLCYNECYHYSLDLENPEQREMIVLNGKPQTLMLIPDDCQ